MTETTTMCLYCGRTNIPLVWDDSQSRYVAKTHDDEERDNRPCPGSGR